MGSSNNRTLIIVLVVVGALFCCCLPALVGAFYALWTYGDLLTGTASSWPMLMIF